MELVQIGRQPAGPQTLGTGVQARSLRGSEKGALAVAALGVVLCTVAWFTPGTLSRWLSGWGALLASYGAVTVGLGAYFWLSYRGTPPGIKHHGTFGSDLLNRGALGWFAGVALTAFYVLLYWHAGALEGLVRLADPLAYVLRGKAADQWFLYGLFYTLAVCVFALRMALKYRHNRYQLLRTASVTFFQLGFGFTVPYLLEKAGEKDFYFTYFWPLKPEYLLPFGFDWVMDPGEFGRFFLIWGALMTFVGTPVLTYSFGKRWYCSWVCGCGGLAETMGDPWRQLSDKSERAWRIERVMIHSVLAIIVVFTAVLWINEATGHKLIANGWEAFRVSYYFLIGSVFSGVVGVGFYPLMGSRVWCRFGCPQAAILGLIQRFFSRFRITTNGGQCISCGNCSTYCEMGIDVRAYAQRGDNIVRASCVGCGVCAAVCPRGVLKLENGPVGDRFVHADSPLVAIGDAFRGRPKG